MKARVIATGVELEVHLVDKQARYIGSDGVTYWEEDLDFGTEDKDNTDYWTRLEHQAAIAAMQGALANNDLLMQLLKRAKSGSRITHVAVEFANACAHTFVEKLKEKEK